MNYRIFFGYREGIEDGKELVCAIYNQIKQRKMYQDIFGNPYLSIKDEHLSFLNLDFLNDIEFFIMPYSPGFFEGFCKEITRKPVVQREIEYALNLIKNGKNINFIPIIFKGFDTKSVKNILEATIDERYQDIIYKISGASQNIVFNGDNKTEVIDSVCEILIKPKPYNVYIGTKKEIESIPLFRRLYGVKSLTFLNYAGSSFISGAKMAEAYDDEMKSWFYDNLSKGNIKCNIILTNPDSAAATDASLYKMYPEKLNIEEFRRYTYDNISVPDAYKYIIKHNLNTIGEYLRINRNANIKVYLTDIALPYGIMKTEYYDEVKDSIQVTIYAPLINNDNDRPSFVINKTNEATKKIYSILDDSLNNFFYNKFCFRYEPIVSIEFLLKQPIIHRANMGNGYKESSLKAIECCALKNYPIELDLLYVEGSILVWRNEKMDKYEGYGEDDELYQMSKYDVEQIRKQLTLPGDKFSQMMTLPELVDYLNYFAKINKKSKSVPLLLEFKTEYLKKSEDIKRLVIDTCNIMHGYNGDFAIHSTDTKALLMVKSFDIRIPCGQITLDFNSNGYDVDEKKKKYHENVEYSKVIIPDFISVKNGDFFNNYKFLNFVKENDIKLLCWTIKNRQEMRNAKRADLSYDNFIIEYDPLGD